MTSPEHLSAQICNDAHISMMESGLKLMESYPQFTVGEIVKFKKTVGWIKANRFTGDKLVRHRKDFWAFVSEHDKRRV